MPFLPPTFFTLLSAREKIRSNSSAVSGRNMEGKYSEAKSPPPAREWSSSELGSGMHRSCARYKKGAPLPRIPFSSRGMVCIF